MNLYPYQKKIFDSIIANFQNRNRQMMVVPTGGGKTVIFSHIVKHLSLRTLIVAHTKELITQCKKTLNRLGVENAEIMTIQKVSKLLHYGNLDEYELLIIDECHRAGAPIYLKLIDHINKEKILGVTATPFRHDTINLANIFGEISCPLSLMDMIDQKLLCDFEGYRIKTNNSLAGVSTANGDFVPSKLEPVINVKNRNELIVREYLKIAKGEKTLCFAINIKHCDALAEEFKKTGIACKSIHGKISKTAREQIIYEFKTGKIQVLVNCQILTEGFDEPSITCLLMARPTCSKILYTQMIGRGSRLFPGKKICKVIEFTDNYYDVCSIEKLIDSKTNLHTIKQGERLSKFQQRIDALLSNETQETITEKMEVITKHLSIYQRLATEWQRAYLMNLKIKFHEPLTEFTANLLIAQASNG